MTESKSPDKTPLAAAASREKIETHGSLQSSRSSRLEDFPCPICHYISKGFWKREDSAAPFVGLNNPVLHAFVEKLRAEHLSGLGTACGCTSCHFIPAYAEEGHAPHAQPVMYHGPGLQQPYSEEDRTKERKLTELNLEGNGVGCSSIPAILSKIKRCANLRSLWLSNNDIGLHGLIMLADFLASPIRICGECRSNEIKLQMRGWNMMPAAPPSIREDNSAKPTPTGSADRRGQGANEGGAPISAAAEHILPLTCSGCGAEVFNKTMLREDLQSSEQDKPIPHILSCSRLPGPFAATCCRYCMNCMVAMDSPACYPPNPLWKYHETASISLSNNSFGRIHLAAEIFDIVLRNNYKLHTVWCNNNVFTGMQARQRFAVNNDKTPEEERYARTTLNAARSKMQAAVHVYVNEQIKPKSQRVKVIPDAGQVLLNWLSSGNGPLLLSSRARAGMWTPEPVEMPCVDALRMTKASGFDLVVVQRAEVPLCVIMNFTRRTCWL